MRTPGRASRRFPSPKRFAVAAVGLSLVLPVGALLLGSTRVREVALDLGPGDGPFTLGFSRPRPDAFDPYEIENGQATHWTSHEARIRLPLEVDAPAVTVEVRLARHFKDRGHLELCLLGAEAERFEIGSGYREYATTLPRAEATPLVLELRTDGRDDRGLGVSLDWVRFRSPPGSRLRLTGTSRLRPILTVALVGLVLLGGGVTLPWAAAASLLLALATSAGLLLDPWLTFRLLRGVPETLLLPILPLLVLGRVLAARSAMDGQVARTAAALLVFGFLFRALAVNHPDFYYPDFRSHAGLALMTREAGLDLLRAPHDWIFTPRPHQERGGALLRATSGLWLKRIGGMDVGLPYSVLPHALLALFPLDYDGCLVALRLVGAAFSAVPAFLCVFLGQRLGLPLWTALLVAAAPATAVELSLGAIPALLGHAADLGVLLLLASPHAGERSARRTAGLAAAVAGAQLTYVSSILLAPALVLASALFLWPAAPDGRRRASRLALSALVGSLVALLLYYRDFLPDTLAAARALALAPAATLGADPGADRPWLALAAWASPATPLLALAGIALLLAGHDRRDASPAVVRGWALAILTLGVLRHLFPGALGFFHLPLGAAPLVALGVGRALVFALARGRGGRVLAITLATVLLAHGLVLQVLALGSSRL